MIAAEPATPPEIESVTLDGGPEVILLHRGRVPWVSFRIALRMGSAQDPAGKSGLARIAGIVLRDAIRETDDKDEPRMVERMGLVVDVETGLVSTAIFGGVPAEHFEDAMKRILGVLAKPPSSDSDVRGAIARALEERQAAIADDRRLAEGEARRAIYGAHAYGRPPRGDARELALSSSEDVRSLFRRALRRESIVVALALGAALPSADVKALIASASSEIAPGKAADAEPLARVEALKGRRLIIVDKPDRREVNILASTLAPGARDPRASAALAANAAIGGALSARLERTLGAKIQATALSTLFLAPESGVFTVWVTADPKKVQQAVRAALDEMGNIAKNSLSEQEVALGRSYAAARAQLELRDPARALSAIVAARMMGLAADHPGSLVQAIQKLSDEDVKREARAMAAPEAAALVVVASATSQLQAELARIPGIKQVSIVSSDDR
jgi:zinc protease